MKVGNMFRDDPDAVVENSLGYHLNPSLKTGEVINRDIQDEKDTTRDDLISRFFAIDENDRRVETIKPGFSCISCISLLYGFSDFL